MMDFRFTSRFADDWTKLKKQQPRLGAKVMDLLMNMRQTPLEGIGKPEGLKGNLSGYWSRRINQEHRLVYRVEEQVITVISCFGHYTDLEDLV